MLLLETSWSMTADELLVLSSSWFKLLQLIWAYDGGKDITKAVLDTLPPMVLADSTLTFTKFTVG